MSASTIKRIGREVRRRRIAAGLTQKELGEKAGVCGLAVLQLEHAQVSSIRLTTLLGIAKALDVDPAELLGGGQ